MSPSYLKDIFIVNRILEWQVFFLLHFKHAIQCFLASTLSVDKSVVLIWGLFFYLVIAAEMMIN